jgi:hypothetical protein
MADVIFVALVLGFFGLATLLVRACDRIIGPDPVPAHAADGPDATTIATPTELVAS